MHLGRAGGCCAAPIKPSEARWCRAALRRAQNAGARCTAARHSWSREPGARGETNWIRLPCARGAPAHCINPKGISLSPRDMHGAPAARSPPVSPRSAASPSRPKKPAQPQAQAQAPAPAPAQAQAAAAAAAAGAAGSAPTMSSVGGGKPTTAASATAASAAGQPSPGPSAAKKDMRKPSNAAQAIQRRRNRPPLPGADSQRAVRHVNHSERPPVPGAKGITEDAEALAQLHIRYIINCSKDIRRMSTTRSRA